MPVEKHSDAESELRRKVGRDRSFLMPALGTEVGSPYSPLSVPHQPVAKTALDANKNLEVQSSQQAWGSFRE